MATWRSMCGRNPMCYATSPEHWPPWASPPLVSARRATSTDGYGTEHRSTYSSPKASDGLPVQDAYHGRHTLATPGAQQAIKRSEPVTVQVEDEVAAIRRPNVLGALVAKAAAFSVPSDPAKERHLTDFATLAAMALGSDRIGQQMTTRDRHYLVPMLVALDNSRRLWASIDGAERGILALAAVTKMSARRTGVAPPSPYTSPEPPAPAL